MMPSGPEALVARKALDHSSLHFIREFLPREFQVALGLPCGLALVGMSNGVEDSARETIASSKAAAV
jgi:hypothetical protein